MCIIYDVIFCTETALKKIEVCLISLYTVLTVFTILAEFDKSHLKVTNAGEHPPI